MKANLKQLRTWLDNSDWLEELIQQKQSRPYEEAIRKDGVPEWTKSLLLDGANIINLYIIMSGYLDIEYIRLRTKEKKPAREVEAAIGLCWAQFWDIANDLID